MNENKQSCYNFWRGLSKEYAMKQQYLYLILLYMLSVTVLFVACNHTNHEDEFPMPEGTGEMIADLQTDNDSPAQNIHLPCRCNAR